MAIWNPMDYSKDYDAEIKRLQAAPASAESMAQIGTLNNLRDQKIINDPALLAKYGSTLSNPALLPKPVNPAPDATAEAIKAALARAQGFDANSQLNSYLSNWTPGMNQSQYVQQARNAGTSAANLKYNAVAADLKQRVTNILMQYNQKLGGVDKEYTGAYNTNAQGAYDAKENVKKTMARRGLLTSSVDNANQQMVGNAYAAQKTGIDLQRQGQKDELNNQILNTNTNLEMDLNQIEAEKGDYLANVETQSVKDYNDYIDKQKQQATQNFLQGLGLNIDSSKAANDLLGMLANYGIENSKLQQNADQFKQNTDLKYKELDQNQSQFNAKLTQEADQFAQQLGFNKDELKERTRQFDAKLGFDKWQTTQQLNAQYAELGNRMAIAKMDNGVAIQRLNQEKSQFDKELEVELRKYDDSMTTTYMAENNRVDEQIAKYSQIDGGQKMIPYIISSSYLPQYVKQEKIRMINNMYGPNSGADTPYASDYWMMDDNRVGQ